MTKSDGNEACRCMFPPMAMWMVLLVFYIYQFIARSAFPTVLTDQYMKFFELDAKGVGALASCYYFVYTFAQIPVGILIDKCSIRLVGTLATATCAMGILIFIATPNFYVAGFGQMLVGLGAAFAFISTLKIIVNWFPPEKNAIMTSLTMSFGCMGPVVAGPSVAVIVNHFEWRNVILIFGILGLILAAAVWIIVRDKESMPHESHEEISLIESLKIIITSPQALVLSLFIMMLYAPLSALGDLWGVPFIKRMYLCSAETAALINNMIYIGMVFGCPFFAHLSNIMNSFKKPMIIGTIVCTIAFGVALFCSVPMWIMFVVFLMVGFGCGAMLSYSLASFLFPSSMNATVNGFINMASMISGVVLQPLIGYVMDLCWNGAMEDGIKVYQVSDFKMGFLAVFGALVLGVLSAFMVKDRAPQEK